MTLEGNEEPRNSLSETCLVRYPPIWMTRPVIVSRKTGGGNVEFEDHGTGNATQVLETNRGIDTRGLVQNRSPESRGRALFGSRPIPITYSCFLIHVPFGGLRCPRFARVRTYRNMNGMP